MQCIETISMSQPSQIGLEPLLKSPEESLPIQTFIREDPEEWIRSHIVGRNMLLKAQLLGRLGMGSKMMSSMSKEEIKKLSKIHDYDRKEREDEEESLVPIVPNEDIIIDRSYSNAEGDFLINFCQKTDDEMRHGYINRLVNMKILKLEPAKKHQTMIIFDWDDTLLCTKFLARFNFDIPQEILKTLEPLDDSASKLLKKSVKYGQTFIITNSAKGWVQCSANLFLPKTLQVILDNNIRVISARSGYAGMFPGDSHRWKVEAFLDIERYFDKNIITNLLCLGDSHIEMDAAHILAQKFSQALIKTIKLKVNPKPDELVKQQDLIREKMEQIYISTRNLTIRLEKTRC